MSAGWQIIYTGDVPIAYEDHGYGYLVIHNTPVGWHTANGELTTLRLLSKYGFLTAIRDDVALFRTREAAEQALAAAIMRGEADE
jgi:hypothetical protein